MLILLQMFGRTLQEKRSLHLSITRRIAVTNIPNSGGKPSRIFRISIPRQRIELRYRHTSRAEIDCNTARPAYR